MLVIIYSKLLILAVRPKRYEKLPTAPIQEAIFEEKIFRIFFTQKKEVLTKLLIATKYKTGLYLDLLGFLLGNHLFHRFSIKISARFALLKNNSRNFRLRMAAGWNRGLKLKDAPRYPDPRAVNPPCRWHNRGQALGLLPQNGALPVLAMRWSGWHPTLD